MITLQAAVICYHNSGLYSEVYMPHIYITGDTHVYIDYKKLTMKRFPEQKGLIREDVVIITGDFGVPWAERLLQIKYSVPKA
jgi:hypothetical protein